MRRCDVKHSTNWLLWLLGVVTTVAGPAASIAQEPDFVMELNHAREVVHEGPAKAFYDGPFNQAFYAKFSGWLNSCSQHTGRPVDDLDLIVTLGPEGKVQAIRFEPRSEGTRCFAELVKKETFPPPPSKGLAVPVSIRMSKQ
jgi:hypothetical protein